MSMRDNAVAIPSIEILTSLVASKNTLLMNQLIADEVAELKMEFDEDELDEDDQEEFDDSLSEFKGQVESLILCDVPPDQEPGAWNFIFQKVIRQLVPDAEYNLPLNNDYRHFYVWEPYIADVSAGLSAESINLLEHLDKGRPLRGSSIERDGTQFSWLTAAEVLSLQEELLRVDVARLRPDLHEFHDDLQESLRIASQKQFALFVSSH